MADFFITQQPTAVWEANNPTLEANQLGVCSDLRDNIETDTGIARLGNGVDRWNDLPNFNPTNSSQVLFSYLEDTITYNDTAALADTALSVTVAAAGIYEIELVVNSTSAVRQLNMDFAGTATIANFVGEALVFVDGSMFSTGQLTSAGTDWASTMGAVAGGFNVQYRFSGSVEITDAGTFLLRGAQDLANASNTTILRGSTLTLTKRN